MGKGPDTQTVSRRPVPDHDDGCIGRRGRSARRPGRHFAAAHGDRGHGHGGHRHGRDHNPARAHQHPALHPSGPAGDRFRGHACSGVARHRLSARRARGLRRPYRDAVQGRLGAPPRHPGDVWLRAHPAAVRRRGVERFAPGRAHPASLASSSTRSSGSTSGRAKIVRDSGIWTAFAHDLNRAGKMARDVGLRLGYHNHNWQILPAHRRPVEDRIRRAHRGDRPALCPLRAGPVWGVAWGARPGGHPPAHRRARPPVPRQGPKPGRGASRTRATASSTSCGSSRRRRWLSTSWSATIGGRHLGPPPTRSSRRESATSSWPT